MKLKNMNYYGYTKEQYESCRSQIIERNLKWSGIFALIFTVVMAAFSLLGFWNILNPEFRWIYFFFTLLSLAAFIITRNREFARKHWAIVTYLVVAVMLLFGVTASAVDSSVVATAFLVLMILVGVLFSDTMGRMAAMILAMGVILVVLSFRLKGEIIGGQDLTNCATYYFVALVFRYVMQKETIERFLVINRYEQTQKELDFLSSWDMLSGVLNRRVFFELTEKICPLEQGLPIAFGVLDIDDFKTINDQHGHQAGDEVIRQIGDLLKEVLHMPPKDQWDRETFIRDSRKNLVARLGGDEFIFLIRNREQEESVEALVSRIQTRAGEIAFDQVSGIHCSIGVIQTNGQSCDINQVYRQADILLYEAKKKGKNRMEIGEFRTE